MPVYRRIGQTVFDTQFLSFLRASKSVLVEVGNLSVDTTSLDVYELLVSRLEETCCSFSLLVNATDETSIEHRLFSEFLEYANQIRVDTRSKCETVTRRHEELNTGYTCPLTYSHRVIYYYSVV